MPDAITSLKDDHKKVKALFTQFEKLGDGAKTRQQEVVNKIIEELTIHAAIEEQVFYPAARAAAPDAKDEILEGLEEHHIVKWTCAELEDMTPADERFKAKVTVLIESVRHHIKDEETEMFPKIREALGRKRLVEIGETLETARQTAPKSPQPKMPDTPPGNFDGATTEVKEEVIDLVERGPVKSESPRQRLLAGKRSKARSNR